MNNTAPILCPLDNRRTTTELWVKFAVVHFTTIAGFCHLLSIRGEPILSWRLFFYVSVPLLTIVQHALAIITVLAAWAYSVLGSKPLEEGTVVRSFRWLFGTLPKEESVDYTSLRAPARTEGSAQRLAKKLGRIIIALGFLSQCIGTVYVYSRRKARGAVAMADQRVLEFGCSGILTAVLTLGLLLKIPGFGQPVPERPPKSRTLLEDVVIAFRDTCTPPFIDEDDDAPKIAQFMRDAGLSLVILVALNRRWIFRIVGSWFRPTYWNSTGNDLPWVILMFALALSGLCAILTTCGSPRSKASRYGKRNTRSFRREGDPPAWMCLFCPCVMALLVFPMVLALGFILSILYGFLSIILISDQISSFSFWPTDTTCPLLWSDPVSQWVWWLA